MPPVVTFRALFEMEPTDPDVFVAGSLEYPWGQVYGGQVAAQGLWAAGQTVDPEYHPHSLHAYFIRRGRFDESIVYEVDRIRDGRSFATRRVLARQAGGVMLNLSASFHRPEDGETVVAIEPPVGIPPAEDLGSVDPWLASVDRREDPEDRARAWLRIIEDYDSSPLMEAVAHTFASDDMPTEAVMRAHPLGRPYHDPEGSSPGDDGASTLVAEPHPYMTASLDHAVWFHDLTPATRWTLHDFRSSGVRGARGHASGELWTSDGRHVATVAQEVLLRVTG